MYFIEKKRKKRHCRVHVCPVDNMFTPAIPAEWHVLNKDYPLPV